MDFNTDKKKYLISGLIIILVLIFLIIIFWNYTNKNTGNESTVKEVCVIKKAEIPNKKFGLFIDSFRVENIKVKKNENLSELLLRKGISYSTIDKIDKISKPVFDARKIKKNQSCYYFSSKDSLKKLEYFIYKINPIEYVVYQLKDSLSVYTGKLPVTKKIKSVSGIISKSLWSCMEKNDINPVLALQLSDIYQWTIDFFGIQKGDKFRVIYEENYIEGKPLDISNIYACQFQHIGEDSYAFLFTQDSISDYFDEKGNSLKKVFLKAPLKFSRISSHFTYHRYHPILKITRPHFGVDYAAPKGTPVHSIGDGIVTRKGYQKRGGGNYVYIKHNSVYTTSYMHLNRFAKGIHPGTRVHQGQLIGYVGMTGLATGPHLDFRVFKNGTPMNPLKVKSPPVKPVSKENMTAFISIKDSIKTELNNIDFEL